MYLNQLTHNASTHTQTSAVHNNPAHVVDEEKVVEFRLTNTVSDSETSPSASVKEASTLDTSKGDIKISLDDYFSNAKTTHQGKLNLDEIPLILPSMRNVSELADYTENKLNDLASSYGIPELPEQLHFDQDGQLVLPDDYPYAEELEAAFDENPGVLEAARTLTSIASHAFAIQERMAFNEQYAASNSNAERERLLTQYGHLFSDSNTGQTISLRFMDNNTMLLAEV